MALTLAPDAANEIPDRALERVITSWLNETILATAEYEKVHAEMCRTIVSCRGTIGNPEGQLRFAKKVRAAFGDRLVYSRLLAGRRKRFTLAIDYAIAVDPWQTNKPVEVGGNAWVCVLRRVTAGMGPRKDIEATSYPVAWFTRHLLKRLTMRAGVLSVDDLRTAIWDGWGNVSTVERVVVHEKFPVGTEILIPARTSLVDEPIVFAGVMDERGLVLRTVLSWDMLSDRQRDACDKLLVAISGADVFAAALIHEDVAPLVAGVANI